MNGKPDLAEVNFYKCEERGGRGHAQNILWNRVQLIVEFEFTEEPYFLKKLFAEHLKRKNHRLQLWAVLVFCLWGREKG